MMGAISGAATNGIGTYASTIPQLGSRIAIQALSHAFFQGTVSGVQGGNFWTGFASGAISSVVSSVWGGGKMEKSNTAWKGLGGSWGHSDFGTIAFGTVSGGAGAALTGGNFWQGAATGLVVSTLNHAMHSEDGDIDPPTKKKTTTTSNTNESNLNSGSAIVGYEGTLLSKSEILIKSGAKGASFADRRHISKTLKLTSKVGKGLGVAGTALTAYEDYNSGGLTWGTAAKVGIGGVLLFASAPVALEYAVIDLSWGLATGTTITDNYWKLCKSKNKVNEKYF
ncbi:MAG TPA: hypothetical protein VFR70_00970 [Flavobacterium sp.]|nr:hypothetical protein [Flavobacterium sp.]